MIKHNINNSESYENFMINIINFISPYYLKLMKIDIEILKTFINTQIYDYFNLLKLNIKNNINITMFFKLINEEIITDIMYVFQIFRLFENENSNDKCEENNNNIVCNQFGVKLCKHPKMNITFECKKCNHYI